MSEDNKNEVVEEIEATNPKDEVTKLAKDSKSESTKKKSESTVKKPKAKSSKEVTKPKTSVTATRKKEEPEAEVKEENLSEAKPHVEEIATPTLTKKTENVEGEFDWESFEQGDVSYDEKKRSNMDAIYEKTMTSISEKEVIVGSVVSISKKEVVVNIGSKSEGVISASEFRYLEDLKVGDEVEVFVELLEDKDGSLVVSHKRARIYSAWAKVNSSLETGEILTGFIKCRTKGGLIADVFGIEAFLPGSQIDVKPIRDYDIYVGKRMEFKVVKINHEFKNVVVSHKALIEAELEEQKIQIIGKLEKGQVLEGTVKNITSYGVFIDLGGVDGLIHITDLSWGRVNHPDEIVELDQKINVVILDFDDNKKRIALGLKQLLAHPWDSLDKELKIGDKLKGKVVVITDYGAFVEIASGVEGLIHVSEMSWSQHLQSAQDFLKVGDVVDAQILTLDREDRKMSLGMKQLIPDPWDDIESKYPVNSKHKSIVRNYTNFGVFVEMEEGVDGLIHISDLSWSKKIKHPSEFCNIGDDVEVVVLELDRENRRLSLGHKQLEENPWDVFEKVFGVGTVHEGTITEVNDNTRSAIISLPYGVEGYATFKQLQKEDDSLGKIEEKLSFVVTEFNKNAKKIVVSHTKTFKNTPAPEVKKKRKSTTEKAVKEINKNITKTTLGDIGALADLKKDMDDKENSKK